MATLRLFASAKDVAKCSSLEVQAASVAEVLDIAIDAFGDEFQQVLNISRIWVNGEPASKNTLVTEKDEIAVLPPVSGG